MSTDFPIKLMLEPPAGVTIAKTEFTAGKGEKGDADAVRRAGARVHRARRPPDKPAARTRSSGTSSSASATRRAATRRSSRSRSRSQRNELASLTWPTSLTSSRDTLLGLHESVREDFTRNRRVMSFAEYLAARVRASRRASCAARPSTSSTASTTTAPRRSSIRGARSRRFKLFDAPWANGEDRLFGQENVQNQVYRVLRTFVQDGRPNKLILLHGPNGSAKSTFIRCLGRGARALLDARRGRALSVQLDLPGAEEHARRHRLRRRNADDRIARVVRVPARRSDRRAARRRAARSPAAADPARRAPEADRQAARRQRTSTSATTCAAARCRRSNRAIYDALLASYQGDYVQVLRHVRDRAVRDLAPLPPGLGHRRAAAVGRRDRAPDHRRSLARRAAAVAAVGRRSTSTAARSSARTAA